MGVKKNFIYSSVLTVSNYIFPLITYPYVSRVLGVTNIGICNFVDSIIQYFILFSMMGIAATGIREIASNKNDKDKLSSTFTSLLCLNALFTGIALVVLLVLTFTVPKFLEHKILMLIGASKLVANSLLFEWFYKGLEDFKYITKRTIIVKCLYVVSVFVFVRKAEDYPIYFLLVTMTIVLNAIINVAHSRHYISLSFNSVRFKPYIKSYLTVGLYLVLSSFYTSFNVAFLGFVSNPTEVGYYTTATKLYSIIIAVFTAFTGVMLPRMSALRSQGNMDEFMQLIKKSVGILASFAIPIIYVCTVFASDIILVLSGEGYEGAFLPMRIIMPLVFIIGYEQILVLQILIPMKKDNAILINSTVGAVLGIVLNVILASNFQAVGSAIVWLSSELIILILSQYWVHHYLKLVFPWQLLLKNTVAYLPVLLIALVIYVFVDSNSFIRLALAGALTVGAAGIIQYVFLKDEVVLNLLNRAVSNVSK